jgi:hypothetical protein
MNKILENGFQSWDYVDSAELYRRIQPDILISGHWDPIHVTPKYLNSILEKGNEIRPTR